MTELAEKRILDKLERIESMFGGIRISVKEAARIKKVNPKTILRRINKGELKATKEGREYQIQLSDL